LTIFLNVVFQKLQKIFFSAETKEAQRLLVKRYLSDRHMIDSNTLENTRRPIGSEPKDGVTVELAKCQSVNCFSTKRCDAPKKVLLKISVIFSQYWKKTWMNLLNHFYARNFEL
jgi:hypothetical protein